MAVTNPYYEFTPTFTARTKARAGELNTQLAAVQTAFDSLPAVADASTTGRAVFAPETGSGNAFVVTMPNTRISNQDGDKVIFFASHGNTGAATLNVDSIGAVAMVDRLGAALTTGAIVSGLLYEATYDDTNTRFVLDANFTEVTNILDTIQGTSSNDPTSGGSTHDADLEFQNAAGDPLAQVSFLDESAVATGDLYVRNRQHGGNIIFQAEHTDGTLVDIVEMRRAATALSTTRFQDNITLLQTSAGVANIDIRDSAGVTTQYRFESNGSGSWIEEFRDHGDDYLISMEDTGGTPTSMLFMDPDDTDAPVQARNAAAAALERVLTASDASITATTTELEQDTDAINTSARKVEGYMVFNSTTNKPVWAAGNADVDVWVDATGATAHTPV